MPGRKVQHTPGCATTVENCNWNRPATNMVPSRKASTIRNRVYLPVSSGHYSVGCADLANKEVFLRLYFPHLFHETADDKEAYLKSQVDRWPNWFPEPDYATAYVNMKSARDRPQWMGRVGTWVSCNPLCPVIQNASIAKNDDNPTQFPLIIFSHGNGGCRTTYSLLCSEMASKGYVVAAIEHADGSACLARQLDAAGGLTWFKALRLETENYATRNTQVCTRSRECKNAFDLMRNLNSGQRLNEISIPFDEKEEFVLDGWRNRLDFSKGVSLSGHSFGGATAVRALQTYECFTSAFCFDAWMYPVHEEARKLSKLGEKPLMFLNYEKFQWRINLEGIRVFQRKLAVLDHGLHRGSLASNVVTIKEATHYTCTDLLTIFNGSYIKYPLGLLAAVGRLFSRQSSRPAPSDGVSVLTGEQGWCLSLDVYSSWLNSVHLTSVAQDSSNLSGTLHDNQSYFIWGTDYKD